MFTFNRRNKVFGIYYLSFIYSQCFCKDNQASIIYIYLFFRFLINEIIYIFFTSKILKALLLKRFLKSIFLSMRLVKVFQSLIIFVIQLFEISGIDDLSNIKENQFFFFFLSFKIFYDSDRFSSEQQDLNKMIYALSQKFYYK